MSKTKDPRPVPVWFSDPKRMGHCPCGNPPEGEMFMVVDTLKRWFHKQCIGFLEYEDPEEYKRMMEWLERGEENDE